MIKKVYEYGMNANKSGLVKDCSQDSLFTDYVYGETFLGSSERHECIESWEKGWEDSKNKK